MVLRGTGIHEPRATARDAAAGGCGADGLAAVGSCAERGQRVSAGANDPCSGARPGNRAGDRAYLRGRLGVSGVGPDRGYRPPGSPEANFISLISTALNPELEGECRDAYNARLLKRSKLLIEV